MPREGGRNDGYSGKGKITQTHFTPFPSGVIRPYSIVDIKLAEIEDEVKRLSLRIAVLEAEDAGEKRIEELEARTERLAIAHNRRIEDLETAQSRGDEDKMRKPSATCANCQSVFLLDEVEHQIYRDGPEEGPLVPLCEDCGAEASPTCEQIWANIRERRR